MPMSEMLVDGSSLTKYIAFTFIELLIGWELNKENLFCEIKYLMDFDDCLDEFIRLRDFGVIHPSFRSDS